MTELTSFMLERLWEDGELVLFRGKRDAGLARVLVMAPALEQPAPETIARLHQAYSLAAKMDPAWAARPLEVVHHEGRPALVMEDPGGDPLERLLGHHPAYGLQRFEPHRALFGAGHSESAQLQLRRRFTGTELDSAIAHQIQ